MALDENGKLLWQFDTGHYLWSQPQIVDDVIYLGAMDHFVYAISKDGEELWSAEMGGAVVAAPKISADGSILYVGSMHEQMDALDTSNGDVLWSFDTENSIWGEALLVENTLYFADSGGKIYALDAETGDPVWQTEYSGNVVGRPRSYRRRLCVDDRRGRCQSLSILMAARNGKPRWTVRFTRRRLSATIT